MYKYNIRIYYAKINHQKQQNYNTRFKIMYIKNYYYHYKKSRVLKNVH